VKKLSAEGHIIAIVCAEGDPLYCHLVESYDRKGLLPQEKYSGKLEEAYRILNAERGFRMKAHREHIRARKVRL
jgi:hypothetical protein